MRKNGRKYVQSPGEVAFDLYWLAHLLTGRPDISIDIAAGAAVAEAPANPFFAGWMGSWQRRLVIAKALTAVHDDLADSASRTEAAHAKALEMPLNWSLSPETTKDDLERALLAIDLFPRAALLLLDFEGMRLADAVPLLDAGPDLLKKAQSIGLRELTANLAGANGSAVSDSHAQKHDVRRFTGLSRNFFRSVQTTPV